MLLTLTLVVAAAIVLVVAVCLIAIAYFLHRAGGGKASNLGRLAGGLETIRANTAPLEERMATIAGALSALRDELQAVEGRLAAAVRTLRR